MEFIPLVVIVLIAYVTKGRLRESDGYAWFLTIVCCLTVLIYATTVLK